MSSTRGVSNLNKQVRADLRVVGLNSRGVSFIPRVSLHKLERVDVRKNSLFSETSITVVLVTNRGRGCPFGHPRHRPGQKRERREKESPGGIMPADIHKPHNRARMYLFAKYLAYFHIPLHFFLAFLSPLLFRWSRKRERGW